MRECSLLSRILWTSQCALLTHVGEVLEELFVGDEGALVALRCERAWIASVDQKLDRRVYVVSVVLQHGAMEQ